jgi:hypothetical protein
MGGIIGRYLKIFADIFDYPEISGDICDIWRYPEISRDIRSYLEIPIDIFLTQQSTFLK